MLLADHEIAQLVLYDRMITPFVDKLKRREFNPDTGVEDKIISYGLSSFGYDARLADEFRIFTPATGGLTCIDPKNLQEAAMVEFTGKVCVIPPNSFVLARTIEYFRIPCNVTGLVTNKSTYARCGIIAPSTVLEAGWEGQITLEISNTTPLPAKVYAGEGAVQVLFMAGMHPYTTYADRNGKYQGQTGITLPIM